MRKMKKTTAKRAEAAREVLQAVWLCDFELVTKVQVVAVLEDADGNAWVTVRIEVPALDVDMWFDGEHNAQMKDTEDA